MRGNNTRLFNNLRDEFPKKSEQGFKLRPQRINCVDRTKSGIKAEGDLMTRTITAGRISTRRFAGTRSNTNIGAIRMIGGPSRLSSPVFRDAKISGRTLSRRQEQGKIQGNLDFEMESHALCLAGADFSGSLVRSLIKNNRESNFDNREVHSPRTGKIAELFGFA